jgi:GNAT superfamily N-acetyltransferase
VGRQLNEGLNRNGLRLEQVDYLHPDAQVLVAAVQQEYVARYGGPDETPTKPADFNPPSGAFLVGRLDGALVACGGIRSVGGEVAEIKRMYVDPLVRRRGLARAMLAQLEAMARAAGYTQVVLESGNAQPEALALYFASGYTPVTPYGFYRCHADANSLGKSLVP